jgi:hypothetical protein
MCLILSDSHAWLHKIHLISNDDAAKAVSFFIANRSSLFEL